MKQNIKLKSMIAAIVVALTLNACNTDEIRGLVCFFK